MISANRLTKRYDGKLAADSVTFEIKQGEIVGFIGENGAGKSTVLKMLAGSLHPDNGEVLIDENNLAAHPLLAKRHIGLMPEDPPLTPHLTVLEHLRIQQALRSKSQLGKKAAESALLEHLRHLDLLEVSHQLCGTLSQGFKQRVSFALASFSAPKVLLLDEPTRGLDPKQLRAFRKAIQSYGKHSSILISSHNLYELEQICTRWLFIRDGKLLEDRSYAGKQSRIVYQIKIKDHPDRFLKHLRNHQEIVRAEFSTQQKLILCELASNSTDIILEAALSSQAGLMAMQASKANLEELFSADTQKQS